MKRHPESYGYLHDSEGENRGDIEEIYRTKTKEQNARDM